MDNTNEAAEVVEKQPSKLVDGWFRDRLPEILKRDTLNPVYTGPEDWLYDFYPDLSWTDVYTDIRWFLKHEEFPKIQELLLRKYGFDFQKQLEGDLAIENKTEQS